MLCVQLFLLAFQALCQYMLGHFLLLVNAGFYPGDKRIEQLAAIAEAKLPDFTL